MPTSACRAFINYQAAAEERRQLAADIGEVIRQFVDALVAAGWSEERARDANVRELASSGKEPNMTRGSLSWRRKPSGSSGPSARSALTGPRGRTAGRA